MPSQANANMAAQRTVVTDGTNHTIVAVQMTEDSYAVFCFCPVSFACFNRKIWN